MIYAMDGGLWLHRHLWKGRRLAHLVSTNKDLLLAYGEAIGMPAERLQYRPLKDPRTGIHRNAWRWGRGGPGRPGPAGGGGGAGRRRRPGAPGGGGPGRPPEGAPARP